MLISDGEEALKFLSSGIRNRAIAETRISLFLSLCHSQYKNEKRVSIRKLVLVDLAGSEKVEKRVLRGEFLKKPKPLTNHFLHLEM
ncbi:kinesin-like protein KIN-1 [Tanacetum coccineum]